MAHELAHVQHRDTLTMTITATLAGAISMLGNFAFFFGGNRDNNNPLGFVGVLVAMIVAPLAAMLVQMAISRTREYSADRRGAEICGQPLALASALDKIARTAERIHNPDAERNPGDGASLHHQSAVGRAHGQSVLDPSQHGKPHRALAGDGGGSGGVRMPAPQATAASTGAGAPAPKPPKRQPVGPQSDRAAQRLQGPVVLNDATTRHGRRRPERGASAAVSGQRRRCSRPCSAPGGGKAARRRHRCPHAARRSDRPRPWPSQLPRARHARPGAGARDPGDRAAAIAARSRG